MKIKARQYAQAIYDVAQESNNLVETIDLATAFIDAANHEDKLLNYLSSGSIAFADKVALINDITQGNEYFANWLLILIESGKSRYLRDYVDELINLYNEKHGISKGYVWTTEPVDQSIINRFEELLSNKLDKEVKLQNKINKNIIGGVRLEVGDNVWDNTIKSKLLQLLEKGSEL